MANKSKLFKGLTQEEIVYYYSLLEEELTDYDCGTLCRDDNNGSPFCCVVENAVPFLYKQEFEYLKSVTDLWSVWKPETPDEIELKKTHENGSAIFCKCKGVQFCERENRSISCRTFPLEPYIDKRGALVGLVFMKEFSHGCPLMKRPKDIRQEFVDNHYIFWEKLLLRVPEEYETYKRSSHSYRLSRSKTGKDFPILFPSHLKGKKYLLETI
ncbi:MAG: hypothetical protein SFU98_20135 [Leptospiraceae bacterium]|nr:hypothetical protein [Leptospiraceae bacterium]